MHRTLLLLPFLLLPACHRDRPAAVADPPRQPQQALIPAGSVWGLRTVEAIDSQEAGSGQSFGAVLARELRDDQSRLVVTAGAPVRLVVLEGDGKQQQLGIHSLMFYGSWHLVRPAAETNAPVAGLPLGTLLSAVRESGPPYSYGAPDRQFYTEATGARLRISSGALLLYRAEQAFRFTLPARPEDIRKEAQPVTE